MGTWDDWSVSELKVFAITTLSCLQECTITTSANLTGSSYYSTGLILGDGRSSLSANSCGQVALCNMTRNRRWRCFHQLRACLYIRDPHLDRSGSLTHIDVFQDEHATCDHS